MDVFCICNAQHSSHVWLLKFLQFNFNSSKSSFHLLWLIAPIPDSAGNHSIGKLSCIPCKASRTFSYMSDSLLTLRQSLKGKGTLVIPMSSQTVQPGTQKGLNHCWISEWADKQTNARCIMEDLPPEQKREREGVKPESRIRRVRWICR